MSTTHAAPHCAQSHTFASANPLAERSTRKAVILTVLMMAVEIVGGWTLNSMALLADGWHMSSHALALGLALFAYRFARQHAGDVRFTFGTWKVEVLGGYTSAVLLLGVAALMAFQSVERLFTPKPIQYQEATVIALIGLLVNLICAWWLRDSHGGCATRMGMRAVTTMVTCTRMTVTDMRTRTRVMVMARRRTAI